MEFKFKIGQLIYDEHYGLGMITDRLFFAEKYIEYRVEFCDSPIERDIDDDTSYGYFAEEWIEDKVDEPCLKINIPPFPSRAV